MGKRRVGAAKPKRSKEADKWIYTGSQYERWQKLKMKIGVTSDLHLLSMLLDSYIKSHVPDFYFPHTIPVTSPYVAATSTYTTETVTETVQGTDTSPGNIEIKMECDSDYDIATEETADTFDNSPEHREAITDHHSDKQYSVNTDNTKQPKKRVRIYIEKIVVETNKDNEDGGDDIPADANDCDEESNPDIPDIPDIHQASDEQSANVQESNNVSPKVQESNRESLATKDVHADSVDTSVRLDSDKVIKQETEDNGEYNTANAGPPSGQEKVMGSNSQEELSSHRPENAVVNTQTLHAAIGNQSPDTGDQPTDTENQQTSNSAEIQMKSEQVPASASTSNEANPRHGTSKRRQTTREEENIRMCPHCGKMMKTYSGMRRHMLKHEEIYPHHCAKCGRKFREKQRYIAHLRQEHGEEKIACERCGKKFNYMASFVRHRKQSKQCYKKEKVHFLCTYCGAKFDRQDALKDHINGKHEQLRLIKCTICSREFKWRSCLSYHLRKFHGNADK